ncbi:hypothetical protein D3D02_13675 [Halobellus sp. Atlit-38R]|uniref:hypothetical protein n=1 Tax=Halobellus sp. Atlit-38R TaxID=2282131 RepID=UPI000EF18CB3|nr:hypothetical protein [Halobellus sp. Atlit-38R]RLM87981.1 hypothetical protein D3D02_13675 [Halobellus sp. Atlit-38R]
MTHEHCESGVTRRRLLALSGVGTLASLAGCSGILPGESERTVAADALADAVADGVVCISSELAGTNDENHDISP